MSALGRLECQRLFLVTEPLLAENGMAQRVVQAAKCSAVEVFDQVGRVPAVEVAAQGAARLRAYRPDLVAVLGRGSTLDCGKAMSYFARGGHTLAALPTTSGSFLRLFGWVCCIFGFFLPGYIFFPALAILPSEKVVGGWRRFSARQSCTAEAGRCRHWEGWNVSGCFW